MTNRYTSKAPTNEGPRLEKNNLVSKNHVSWKSHVVGMGEEKFFFN